MGSSPLSPYGSGPGGNVSSPGTRQPLAIDCSGAYPMKASANSCLTAPAVMMDVAAFAKAATGVVGFDDITGGGLPQGRTTLLVGGPGSGKTIFALQFLVHGARHCQEPGIFVAFEENPKRIATNSRASAGNSMCWGPAIGVSRRPATAGSGPVGKLRHLRHAGGRASPGQQHGRPAHRVRRAGHRARTAAGRERTAARGLSPARVVERLRTHRR